MEKQTGLEFWFTPRSGTGTTSDGNNASAGMLPPPHYKKAMVVTGIILVMINTLIPQIRQATARLPILLSMFVGVVIMVLPVTYVVMPFVTWFLRPWLPKKRLF